ncbi:MAG: SprT family zinc-dependent metalloprotease [bacterium]|nr:SprT family zinc-dependent metalloprotease [bacterium]
MQIQINDQLITFQVQYAKRKKISMELSAEGHIFVKAPTKTSEESILEFMRSNSKILLDYQKRLDNRKYISSEKSYDDAENFLYLGRACKLTDLLEEIPEDDALIQAGLKKFYTKRTKEIVKKRVKHFEKVIGVKSKSITIVDSKSAWGTCNSLKELTFNYRLSMAPESVIDYVVIHELCHILHMNHDRSFWRKVGMYDAEFKQKQDYLAHFGGVMTI